MSHSSNSLNDDESLCMTVKVINGLDNLVWINKKKTTIEGCQVFITPRNSSLRGGKLEEDKDHHHHHNYKYKLYKNYYHILSFLHSFIYSIISTFLLLLFTNKVSFNTFSSSFSSFLPLFGSPSPWGNNPSINYVGGSEN